MEWEWDEKKLISKMESNILQYVFFAVVVVVAFLLFVLIYAQTNQHVGLNKHNPRAL